MIVFINQILKINKSKMKNKDRKQINLSSYNLKSQDFNKNSI